MIDRTPIIGDEIENMHGRVFGKVKHIFGEILICEKFLGGHRSESHRISWKWLNHPNFDIRIRHKEADDIYEYFKKFILEKGFIPMDYLSNTGAVYFQATCIDFMSREQREEIFSLANYRKKDVK